MPAKKPYLKPYLEAVDTHGDDFASMLWHNREGQAKRFAVLMEMLGRDLIDGHRVVDLGCGHGDLALELERSGLQPVGYVGVDALEAMVDVARGRTAETAFPTAFEVLDPLVSPEALDDLEADIIVASGTLNAMEAPVALELIKTMLSTARVAIGFNFLSSRGRAGEDTADLGPSHRFDPLAFLVPIFERTPNVAFRQDYLDGHDGTIVAFLDHNS